MRILNVVSRSQRRGAERVALDLSAGLTELGHDSHVVALGHRFDGGVEPELPTLTAGTRLRGVTIGRLALALGRELRAHPVDVVIAHGGLAAQTTAVIPRPIRPGFVWQRILPFATGVWRQPRRWWWSQVARRADACVALSRHDEHELARLGFAGVVARIPNFRDPARFAALDHAVSADALRAELGVPGDVALVGLVGHLVDQKRPERAVEVLARLRRWGHSVHLVVAGDGPLRPAVARLVTETGLAPHVSMLGERTDVPELLAGLDVLVLTSETEGVPGTLIEAQMAGCPVVTYPVGAVAEVVVDGETGVVLERAGIDEMGRALAGLLDDPARLRRLGEAGRARSARFSLAAALRDYDTLLRHLVEPADMSQRGPVTHGPEASETVEG